MQQTQYFPFVGGENLSQPAVTLKPGELLTSANYEAITTGGYRRFKGYERFDGRTSPSEATYRAVPFNTGTIAFVQGDTVTGTLSGATGTVVTTEVQSGTFAGGDAAGFVALTDVTGSFVLDDELQVSAVTNALATGADVFSTNDDTIDETFRQETVTYARSLISEVPGSGPIRGIFFYNDVLYAFRDNVGGTACVLHKSSATGWTTVTTPALAAGGRYRTIEYNFGGSTDTKKVYGVSGVNKAFQFDGTTYTEITTGMTTDTPIHVGAFKKYLFLAFPNGSLQNSGLGDPLSWTPITGAGEIATGDEITGLLTLQGDTLAIGNRNRIYLLQGTTPSNWNLVEFSDESGIAEDSLQRIGGGMFMDDRGLTTLQAVQTFGDFNTASISQKVNSKWISLIPNITCSVRVKSLDQYILYFDTGDALCATYTGDTLVGFTSLRLKHVPNVITNNEDSGGTERIFFGDMDGMVHEYNKGTSMDGLSVESVLRFAFNHVGSPAYNKRFYKVSFEASGGRTITLKFAADFSYGSNDVPTPLEADVTDFQLRGGGAFWDTGTWDQIVWDGQIVGAADIYINGIGKNMSLFIFSEQIFEEPHELQGAIIHYSGRGLVR